MSAAAVRILVVGTPTASTESTLKGLARSGWESHSVKTVREADTVLRTVRFQLTLATEKLPDGTGYELASLIARQTGNLFIAVPLSETCLWLPAVESGVRSLGERALNPLMLKTEAESILQTCEKTAAALESGRGGHRDSSGEVVRGEIRPEGAAVAVNRSERVTWQAHGRFEHGEKTIAREAIAPPRHSLTVLEKTRENGVRVVSKDVAWDLGASKKRWRGL
jgi:DNA-binding NtrC family response regulator